MYVDSMYIHILIIYVKQASASLYPETMATGRVNQGNSRLCDQNSEGSVHVFKLTILHFRAFPVRVNSNGCAASLVERFTRDSQSVQTSSRQVSSELAHSKHHHPIRIPRITLLLLPEHQCLWIFQLL